ncbi:MAG: hypothetical protein KA732_03875 [Providencia sp.]|uniref:hypothetical protein n=1 Tax=Providencia sp. TaxID=589 RepID=UPI001B3D8748|nr:hypothetical protein [Providencia sp.]MBP6080399.1 hypothetical protein [Providencia sp.]
MISQASRFVAAFNKLESSDKVSKKPLNELSKLVNNIEKIVNSSEAKSLTFAGTKSLESRFNALDIKLNKQNSGMLKEKSTKLESIKQSFLKSLSKIEGNELANEKRTLTKELSLSSTALTDVQQNLKQIENKVKDNDNNLKICSDPSESAKLLESFKEKNSSIDNQITQKKSEGSDKIKKMDDQIKNVKSNLLGQIKQIAGDKFSGIKEDLRKAEAGKIYESDKNGLGATSWKAHINDSSYAMEKFGFKLVSGHREYSSKGKELNSTASKFNELVKNYLDPSSTVNNLKMEKQKFTAKLDNQLTELENNKKFTSVDDLKNEIKVFEQDKIVLNESKLENQKNIRMLESKIQRLDEKLTENSKKQNDLTKFMGK